MHAIEKLLAAKSQREEVHAGEIVNCDIDYVGINDLLLPNRKSFYEMGGKQVVHPERVISFFDHYAPCATEKQADKSQEIPGICKRAGHYTCHGH